MTAVGVIPARWGASRFPGKPLVPLAGKPMIQHVFEAARTARRLRDVIVATDDERIVSACEGFGARAVRTSPAHLTGTDRLAEVARRLSDETVVNVQGDEPLIEGFVIDAVIEALEETPEVEMATVVHPADADAAADPNRVKVVMDLRGRALYFSRSPIPAHREGSPPPRLWQHVGLYAYRRDFLLRFVDLPPTEAEQAEALEQLRALEHGCAIQVAVVEGWRSLPVDVPEDVAGVLAALERRSGAGCASAGSSCGGSGASGA